MNIVIASTAFVSAALALEACLEGIYDRVGIRSRLTDEPRRRYGMQYFGGQTLVRKRSNVVFTA